LENILGNGRINLVIDRIGKSMVKFVKTNTYVLLPPLYNLITLERPIWCSWEKGDIIY